MSESVDSRINEIMPVQKGKAFRTTCWRRFERGLTTHDILEAFHDSACDIPHYANVDHALVADVIRGRINWYLTVKGMTVEQVAGKVGQPASLIRDIIQGGENFSSITAPVIEEKPRPVRGKTTKGKSKKAPKASKKTKKNPVADEAADRVVVTIQAILDGEIAEDHTEMVLRGLCRFAHEERLPFADKIESGLTLIGQIPTNIALLGVLDVCTD